MATAATRAASPSTRVTRLAPAPWSGSASAVERCTTSTRDSSTPSALAATRAIIVTVPAPWSAAPVTISNRSGASAVITTPPLPAPPLRR